MRKAFVVLAMAGVMAGGPATTGSAKATVGTPAPAFSLPDPEGTAHSLAAEKGKWVVLEWFNAGCPFVQKHYGSGNMQKLQETFKAKGVTWFSILSSAPGKEGYVTGKDARDQQTQLKSKASALLLDPAGKVGQAYGAKNTPTMVIINPQGKIVYYGAIDSAASTDPMDIAIAVNYVSQALDESLAGKPVTVAQTKPYGCGVKY